VPEDSPRPVPIFLCLQGHSRGMRLSLGEGDRETIGERDFALQAVNRSRADALCHGLV
jgi:hypothetical protein